MLTALSPYGLQSQVCVPSRPAHWQATRLKAVLRECEARGVTEEYPLLSLTRSRGLILQSEASSKAPSASDLSNYKRCEPGQVVMNRMQAWSGMFARADRPGAVSPDYAVFDVSPANDSRYVSLLLRTPVCIEEFAIRSKGIGSGFNRLYSDQLGAVAVHLPPADEQAAIVKYLGHAHARIDQAIAAKRKLIALLEEQKQAIINHAVTRGLDPTVPLKDSGIPWLGEIPAHWRAIPIRYLGRVGNGSTPARSEPGYWADGDFPWLNSSVANQGNVWESDQFVTARALKECHLPRVQPHSVLVAITGQGKTRGKAAVLEFEATINQHLAFIEPRRDQVHHTYLALSLRAAYAELRHLSDDSGSTKGAITCASLKSFQIAVPTLAEQDAIVAHVEGAIRASEGAEARLADEISLLREFRTRLTSDVVTGQVDVREIAATLPELTDDMLATDGDIAGDSVEDITEEYGGDEE